MLTKLGNIMNGVILFCIILIDVYNSKEKSVILQIY